MTESEMTLLLPSSYEIKCDTILKVIHKHTTVTYCSYMVLCNYQPN